MNIQKILDYYIDYENYNLLNSITSISKKNDFSEMKLKDTEMIHNNVMAQKSTLILDLVEYKLSKLGELESNIRNDLKTLCIDSNTLENKEIETRLDLIFEQLFQKPTETSESQKRTIKNELLNKEFYIYYPVYWVDQSYIPLCVFNCSIKSGELKINSYAVAETLLNLLMKKRFIFDEYFTTRKEKEDFFSSLTSFDNIDIFSLVDVIIETIVNKIDFIQDELVSKRQNFFMISLSNTIQSYLPPFKEELVLTNHLLDKYKSELLDDFLLGKRPSDYRNELRNITHFGSYPFGINYKELTRPAYTVNKKQWEIMNLYKDVTLQSVTGPPGTGKTTVLKEIIADMFVNKTKSLLDVWDVKWEVNQDGTHRSPFKGNNDFSMVITSTNNDAVNNIGEELIQEISLFNNSKLKNLKYTFCAKLGKKTNTEQFISDSLVPLIQILSDDHEAIDETILKNDFRETFALLEQFNHLLCDLDTSMGEIENLYGNKLNHLESQSLYEQCNISYKDHMHQVMDSHKKIADLNADKSNLEKEILINKKEIASQKRELNDQIQLLENIDHKSNWMLVGKLIKIFTAKKRDTYQKKHEMISDELVETHKLLNHFEHEFTKVERDIEDCIQMKTHIEMELDKENKILKIIQSYQLKRETLLNFMKEHGINEDLVENRFELCNCEIIATLRVKLFKLSLSLHEAYIIKYKKEILSVLNEIYKPGKNLFSTCYRSTYLYNEEISKDIRNLWEVFCLCYPVISTTLHSFERNKFHMLPQLFDLIMVDESGQVLPHYLVSPFFRSKKALIVGDAFQLQPVRKKKYPQLFEKHEKISNIGKHLDLDIQSAQNIADWHTKFYDVLDGKKIGLMLEEHRRCEENIAIFSNDYVYNDKMILKSKNKPPEGKFLGSNLVFIDVRGYKEIDNKNFAEAEVIKNIIGSIRKNDSRSEIGVITPYSNQQYLLENTINDKKTECGTVHKFQGKGKDIIIISLVVSALDDHRGLSFIGSEPNFLNVALTRAKSQVILVGNYNILSKGNVVLKNLNNVFKRAGSVFSFYDNEIEIDDQYLEIVREILSAGTKKDDQYNTLFSIYEKHNGLLTDKVHYQFLMHLFDHAKSIEVCSPWVNTVVVNRSFLNKLNDFLKKGNKYKITFGYNNKRKSLGTVSEIKEIIAQDSLYEYNEECEVNMMLRLKNLLGDSLIYNPPLHAKILIVDEEYVIIGSHNWLSKQGQGKNSKREVSCIVKNNSMAQFIREEIYSIKEKF